MGIRFRSGILKSGKFNHLIKVSPEWMEVISYTRGVAGDPITWEPPRVIFDSK